MDDKTKNDGGPAFPFEWSPQSIHGISLRDWFATFAPEPKESDVEFQHDMDRRRNPHGDYTKPKIREIGLIKAQLRFKYADAMLEARNGQ